MVSIFGFSELLLKRQFDDHRRRDLLGTIHRQSGLLVNLVNELLDLARIEARQGRDFTRRLVPLQPLVERTLSGLLVHDDPRKVETVLPTDPVLVEVDPDKIQQAITNVLSNAYKYSRGQGRIVLDLVTRQVNGATQVGVRVADEGIGMTPEQLRRVFERFYRADTSGNIPGTGLGMAITKEVLELHGGSVDVASSAGKGTTVTLWLPVSTAASVVAGRAAAEPTTPAPLSAPAALPPASLH
jgi:signal transduction histidine kinase